METVKLARQSLVFQKTFFDNSFSTFMLTQDQAEKMVAACVDQLPFITEDGKKTLRDTLDMAKRARNDFKNAVDEGYNKFEEVLDEKK